MSATQSPSALKVLFLTPEVTPVAKTGGLGDVAGGLPPALAALGLDVRVVMPLYGDIDRAAHGLEDIGLSFAVPVGGLNHQCRVWRGDLNGCPLYLLGNDTLFQRDGLYGDVYGDFGDNLIRFVFLCRGAFELARALDWPASVVHAHDWQAALAMAYLAAAPFDLGPLAKAKGVLTLHNLAFQGIYPRSEFQATGLPPYMDSIDTAEFWGNISLLKAGLMTAAAITTVSPSYAREIQEPELGMGMDGVLRHRAAHLHGILNGVDYGLWSPEADRHLPAAYSADNLGGKAACRNELLKTFGLEPPDQGGMVLGFIGRLAHQKGVDLIAEAAQEMAAQGHRLALLGTGDAGLESRLSHLAETLPGKLGLKLTFSEKLAHLLQAGSDVMLMPSRFEPCGLNQMYALRYGTPPLVRATGGLKDTVEPCDPERNTGDGFVFSIHSSQAMLAELERAAGVFAQPRAWRELQARAMARDFSWTASAQRYASLFKEICKDG
ncbi:MAG: glycogen synthase GlgA [Desulfarculaceae bacterium]|nr:glycogen synthase GlgA [Desulfarculaceae bacterium]MCF8073404.1 glycogen synthase GlgA [Desulfarculaceae bacterium]MCF8103486.1 glycogen synthase GlgA [Desulfarculaceae bacterium]MCF8115815.1 glycogen synthase GlgA [Desulfarculaceae bacterium]